MMARMSHKTRNPQKKKWPKSSSEVGFGGILKVGQKVGLEVGFAAEEKSKIYFRTYFLTNFENSPETYFWATFGPLNFFFRGFLVLWLTRAIINVTSFTLSKLKCNRAREDRTACFNYVNEPPIPWWWCSLPSCCSSNPGEQNRTIITVLVGDWSYTPPVWGVAALLTIQRQRCIKMAKKKQYLLAILRGKKEKGRNKKDDQNWSCFFWSKSALLPQFKAKVCLKGRQKTRPWPWKFMVLRTQDFNTLLVLNCQKRSTSQHWRCINISLPAWPLLKKHGCKGALEAPHRAILRYYRWDIPYRAIPFQEG